jgi:glycerol uptake facilitator-like aquaporin
MDFDPSRSPRRVPATENPADTSTDARVGAEYAVGAAGTFFLIVTVGSVAASANPWAPLAIAALLRAMVDVGRHLLGGQNPKVTLEVLAGHQISLGGAVAYWLVQLAGVATMSLAGRSLMAAFAADAARLVAARSRDQAGA